MMKFRVSVMLCLALGLLSSYVYGQPAAQYTGQPATNAERKEMIAEADSYVAAFKDPEKAFKDDQANVFKYLAIPPYDVPRVATQGLMGLRTLMAKKLLARAQYDPLFDGVLKIAGTDFEDRVTAIQATQLLVDALKTYSKQFPGTMEPSKQILLKRLESPLFGVKFAAITGLGYTGNSAATPEVLDALVAQLKSDEELIIDAAAAALAELGDRRALPALAARLADLPDDGGPIEDVDEASPGAAKPSDKPLSQARLSVALAVQRLAGLSAITPEMLRAGERNEMLRAYEVLLNWWEEHKGEYI